jgi:hypothetical protein
VPVARLAPPHDGAAGRDRDFLVGFGVGNPFVDRLRAWLNMVVGVGLVLFSVFYVGLRVGVAKRAYMDWEMNPQHGMAAEKSAAALWPGIQRYQNEDKVLWAVAPYHTFLFICC